MRFRNELTNARQRGWIPLDSQIYNPNQISRSTIDVWYCAEKIAISSIKEYK